MSSRLPRYLAIGFLFTLLGTAFAQMPNAYGPPISLEAAKKVAAPAIAEATKNNWSVAVAIVDPSGNLIYYEKMDNTQLGSARISVEKAATAAKFKRPTQAFQDASPRAQKTCASSPCQEWSQPRAAFRY